MKEPQPIDWWDWKHKGAFTKENEVKPLLLFSMERKQSLTTRIRKTGN
jgi:hypothetical protein